MICRSTASTFKAELKSGIHHDSGLPLTKQEQRERISSLGERALTLSPHQREKELRCIDRICACIIADELIPPLSGLSLEQIDILEKTIIDMRVSEDQRIILMTRYVKEVNKEIRTLLEDFVQ